MPIFFFVPGKPVTQGSKFAFVAKGKAGAKPKAIMREQHSDNLRSWHSAVAGVGMTHRRHRYADERPLRAVIAFAMPRPKTHIGKTGLTKQGREFPCVSKKPDIDKLARAVLDALSSNLYPDDAKVVSLWADKFWTDGVQGMYLALYDRILERASIPEEMVRAFGMYEHAAGSLRKMPGAEEHGFDAIEIPELDVIVAEPGQTDLFGGQA